MAMSLADLKKQSNTMLDKIKKSKEDSGGNSRGDDRVWTPTFDKEKGVGYAKVRFLPAPSGEDFPFVTIFSHGFKGPTGKWYIENSLSTLKQKDPVGIMNSSLWNSGIESDKDVARRYKRRTNYFANVLIVDDPMNPELNGTVKLFRYGPMIHKILEASMFPQFETDEPLNPFDPWGGATFEIRIVGKNLNGNIVPNYEKSFFHKPEAVAEDDSEIERIWGECHSLTGLIAEDQFKSFDELKNRLFEVLGPTVGSGIATVEGFSEPVEEKPKAKPSAKSKKDDDEDLPWDDEEKPAKVEETKSSDEDDLDFFENL